MAVTEVQIKGTAMIPTLPPWAPENYGETLPDGSPDWMARIQSALDEHNRVLFSAVYEIAPTNGRQRIIPRPGCLVEGNGRNTGVRLQDDNGFVNGAARAWVFGPVAVTDRFDDVVFRDFDIDLGSQKNHNTTLNAISVVGDRAAVDNVHVSNFRAGNKHEAFVVKAVSQDQNVDSRAWERADPVNHASVTRCLFTRPQDNNEQDEDPARAEVPEVTCVWADVAVDNRCSVPRNARQIAPVHPVAVNAYNRTVAAGNVSTGKGVSTVVWMQQPKIHRWKNPEIYNNTILP